MRLKIFAIFLLIMLAFLQYRLWVEPGGLRKMVKLKHQLSRQIAQNDALKAENEALVKKIKLLQKNDEAMEMRARSELGMIKKDETYYQIVSNDRHH